VLEHLQQREAGDLHALGGVHLWGVARGPRRAAAAHAWNVHGC